MTPEQEAIIHIIQAISHLNERTVTVSGSRSATWINDELTSAWQLVKPDEEKETA